MYQSSIFSLVSSILECWCSPYCESPLWRNEVSVLKLLLVPSWEWGRDHTFTAAVSYSRGLVPEISQTSSQLQTSTSTQMISWTSGSINCFPRQRQVHWFFWFLVFINNFLSNTVVLPTKHTHFRYGTFGTPRDRVSLKFRVTSEYHWLRCSFNHPLHSAHVSEFPVNRLSSHPIFGWKEPWDNCAIDIDSNSTAA